MPPTIANGTRADEIRLNSYKTQMERHHEVEMRELKEKADAEIQKLIEAHTAQKESLETGYAVEISHEAERLDDLLQNQHVSNENRVAEEKKTGDAEFEQVRAASRQKIDEYRKNAQSQMEAIRKELQVSTDSLHERAKQSAKREKEISGA